MSLHPSIFASILLTLVGCAAQNDPIVRSFPAEGINRLVVRADEIQSAVITTDEASRLVEISGIPEGDARGYHPSDPDWRETPASRWGLDFVAQRHGDVLVVSTQNETQHIHHRYVLTALRIRVPTGVEVVREAIQPGWRSEPNLDAP